ncbi:CHAT domain-containing protein [Paenibacillus sp. FSL H8-0317]|uniref:CHAT domain-containing protein n=2 Tax=Paenibacillus TaxID=44249 RepID=UPI00324AE1E3
MEAPATTGTVFFENKVTILLNNIGPDLTQVIAGNLLSHEGEILIVDYYGKPKKSTNPKIEVLNMTSVSVNDLFTSLMEHTNYNYLVINGVERLIKSFNGDGLFIRKIANQRIRFFQQHQLDWNWLSSFVKRLGDLLNEKKAIVCLYVEEDSRDTIYKILEDNDDVDIAVFSMAEEDNVVIDIQKKLLEEMQTKSLEDMIQIIDNQRDQLPKKIINIYKAITYTKHGLKTNAISLYESERVSLQSNELITLADLYYANNEPEKSFEIGKQLIEEDPFVNGVARIIIKSVLAVEFINDNEIRYWLETSEELEKENPEILDFLANGYNQIRDYQKAAIIRRNIYTLNHNPTELLLARFLDLQVSPPTDLGVVSSHVLSQVQEFPDLEAEAHYRLGLFFNINYGSAYKAFEHWSEVPYTTDAPFAFEAAKGRLKILEDNLVACKVLRIRLKDDDVREDKRLLDRKVMELIKSMEVLSTNQKGYLIWGNYIDKSYTKSTWKQGLSKAFLAEIEEWKLVDNEIINQSYLIKKDLEADLDMELTPATSLRLLRKLKSMSFVRGQDEEELLKIIEGGLMYSEASGDIENKVWIRYEAALILGAMGKDQESLNHSLTLFEIASATSEPFNHIARMLAFFSWGNTQFRIGNSTEGVFSIIVGMRLARMTGELGAFVEDGISMIQRIILDQGVVVSSVHKQDLTELFEKFSNRTDAHHVAIHSFILTDDFDKLYDLLNPIIYTFPTELDTNWAIHLSNYIMACIETDRSVEASELITKYSEMVIPHLLVRKDLLIRCLQSWSQILISVKVEDLDGYHLTRRLLKVAVEIMDARRSGLFHKGERANFSDSHRSTLLDYLEILVLIYKGEGFSVEEKQSALQDLLEVFPYISPRSVLETRASDSNLTPELRELEKSYKRIYQEIIMLEHSKEKADLVHKQNEIVEELKKYHPYYRSLSITASSIADLYTELEDKSIFVQYAVLKFGVIVLIASNKKLDVEYVPLDTFKYKEAAKMLGNMLQDSYDYTKEEEELFSIFAESLSEPILIILNDFLASISMGMSEIALNISPDLSLPLFSVSLLNDRGEWLLNKVNGVSNVLDLSQVVNQRVVKKGNTKVVIVTLGSTKDKAIGIARNKIKDWITYPQIIHLELAGQEDEIDKLASLCEKETPSTVIVIGHGISDRNAGLLSGAVGIQGQSHTIWGEEFEKLQELTDNLILISCSAGSSYEEQIESSTGVLNSILSYDFSGVVLCRWDVNAQATFEILDFFLKDITNKGVVNIVDSLVTSQRKLMKIDKWKNPAFWAGLEYWGSRV